MKEQLTQERLKELLWYYPETGVFYWRRGNSNQTVRPWDKAGYLHGQGHILISVDGKQYKAHRLAWLYMTGEWPSDKQVRREGRSLEYQRQGLEGRLPCKRCFSPRRFFPVAGCCGNGCSRVQKPAPRRVCKQLKGHPMTTPTKPQAPAVELPELPDWPEGFPDNWLVTVSEMMRDYARAAIAAAKPEPVGERAELIRKLRRDVTWTPGRHYATQLEEIMDEAANFLEDALLSADAKPAEQANGQEAVYQAQYIGDRWTDVDAQEFESLRGSPTIQSRVLYTTPPAQPAREWVSLTDVQRALEECDVPALYRHSIIDKLREKNAGQPAAARPEIGNQDGKENCHAARPI